MDPIELAQRLGRWSSGRGPLYVLLATRLRTLIDDGELRPGALLPPDRALATALAVGRITVVNAYDRLAVEGRIVRRQGSGTRVAGPAGSEARGTTDAPTFLHLLEPNDDVIMLACAAPDAPPAELVDAYAETLPQYLRVHFVSTPDQLSEAVRRLAVAWAGYDPPATRSPSSPVIAV